MRFPKSQASWKPSYRVIPSRYPPIDIFERVAAPDDWEALQDLEGITSARLREEVGEIHLVRKEDRRFGPGWTPIMAAFCHLRPGGSRFSDGSFGVYYCAMSEATAIAETRFHAEQFMRESSEGPALLHQRVYLSDMSGVLIDLRGPIPEAASLLDPNNWTHGQDLGRLAWDRHEDGILYPSVRDPGGECAAVLRPPVLSAARQSKHLGYEWDGYRIKHVLELKLLA